MRKRYRIFREDVLKKCFVISLIKDSVIVTDVITDEGVYHSRNEMSENKKDWTIFLEKLPGWQEKYMARLEGRYIEMLSDSRKLPSEKFRELEKAMKEDRRSPGVFLELDRKNMEIDIKRLLAYEVITIEDLADFSDELKDSIKESQLF